MSSQLIKIQTIYYLLGHGGRINNGLGQALVARGYEVQTDVVRIENQWKARLGTRKNGHLNSPEIQ